MNSYAVVSASTDVTLFLYSFKDLIPLILHQWYLSHLNHVIRLGLLEPYPWIITHISTPEFQSEFSFSGEKLKKKAKKGESAILSTSSRIWLSFAHYRVVICLDISQSSFTFTSILTHSLLSILAEISASTRSNKRIQGVQLSVIAHMPEIDGTWSIWQGEITSESDVLLLQSLVRSRIERIEEQSLKAKAQATQNPTHMSSLRFPDSDTFLRAILFHLSLLPGDACPKAILLTRGSLTIKTGPTAVINQFSKNHISLNVLIEQISSDRPVGFYSDVCGLKLIAGRTIGGSIEILKNDSITAIEEVCKTFIGRSFFSFLAFGSIYDLRVDSVGFREVGSLNQHLREDLSLNFNHNANANPYASISERSSIASISAEELMGGKGGLKKESSIHTYQLEGTTVEHLLTIRQSEGFRIVNVTHEKENMLSVHATQSGPRETSPRALASTMTKKQPFLSFARQSLQQQQQQPVCIIVIRLEKQVTKLSCLVYQVTYRKEDPISRKLTPNALFLNRNKPVVSSPSSGGQLSMLALRG
jgi:hypothetical protein